MSHLKAQNEQVITLSDTLIITPSQVETSLLERVEQWYSENMSYGAILALMTVESSFIPFPSEVVIPPATYVAANPESVLYVSDNYFINVLLIVLFGTLGAMIGAFINYFLALWLGRPIIYAFADSKIGHLLLLSGEKVAKAEEYFKQYGKVSTFIGRLIPAIRQLISIPAGLSKMNVGIFALYTFWGAFAWNIVLAFIGYIAHGQTDLIHKYSSEIGGFILFIFGLAILYFIVRFFIKKRKNE